VIFDTRRGRDSTYTCRDLEGHIWSFGTYDPRDCAPLIEQSSNANLSGYYVSRLFRALSSKLALRASPLSSRVSTSKREILAGLVSLVGLVGIAAFFYFKSSIFDRTSVQGEFNTLQAELIQARSATQAADAATKHAHQELDLTCAAAPEIEKSLKTAETQRLDEQRERIAAVQRIQAVEQQLAKEKAARQDAEGIAAACGRKVSLRGRRAPQH
jgi:hypothetical protein